MKAEILNPFISATRDVLQTMAGIDPRRGTPRLKGARDVSYDVSGVVGITGQVKGFVVLSFPKPAAFRVVSSFLGEPVTAVDEHVIDAVGELANMVAGGAKRVLSDVGYDMTISIPTVIVGKNHVITRPTGIPCFEVPFEIDVGAFSVELCLKLEA
ncbi:MAG: chemotaxis protein CheX [Deltaproteobacteria bacterium]|nr:chemotaxis protein CheX [Deltaproteobacteria bacterium]